MTEERTVLVGVTDVGNGIWYCSKHSKALFQPKTNNMKSVNVGEADVEGTVHLT